MGLNGVKKVFFLAFVNRRSKKYNTKQGKFGKIFKNTDDEMNFFFLFYAKNKKFLKVYMIFRKI